MILRLTYKQLEGLKEKFGVKVLYSYSRVNSYLQEPWIYRKTYLDKVERGSSCYAMLGNLAHDVIQNHLDGDYPYEEMINKYNEGLLEWKTEHSDLKFINKSVEDSYIASMKNYFQTTKIIPHKIINETPVCIHIPLEDDEDIVFIGYIDSEYVDEDGIFNIVDYKSSSISGFSGKQLKEKAQQLTLYAIGINQVRGIPFEKIRLRFDMMKFYEISFMQKNGKIGKTKAERSKWVEKIIKRLQKDLFELGYDPIETDGLLDVSLMNNSIDNLPQEVQDKYTFDNLYIDVTVTEEEAEELKQMMKETVLEIREKEKGDWEVEFPEPKIDNSNKFFFEQLNSHLLKHHSGYQEEQAMIKGQATDDDLLAMFQ